MTKKQIQDKVNSLKCIWDDVYNDQTDFLWGCTENDSIEEQYEEYKAIYGNERHYYACVIERPITIFKAIAYYSRYPEFQELAEYMINDIAKFLKYFEYED